MITVGQLAPYEQWDQNLLNRLFDNTLYPTGLEFRRVTGYPNTDGAILIIPGRYWHDQTNKISEAIAKYQWVLAIRTGDEENQLDPEKVFHRNIKWWIQTPRQPYEDSRLFGVGFPPHFNTVTDHDRTVDVFLSGQNTHTRRNDCFTAMANTRGDNVVEETAGFTAGMPPSEYTDLMCSAKVAPAPSGAVSPDSFRLYEALEAHTVPIADDVSPVYKSAGYWRMLFPDAPFPILSSYKQLPGYVEDQIASWPANTNRIAAWWIGKKREMSRWLKEDLTELGAL